MNSAFIFTIPFWFLLRILYLRKSSAASPPSPSTSTTSSPTSTYSFGTIFEQWNRRLFLYAAFFAALLTCALSAMGYFLRIHHMLIPSCAQWPRGRGCCHSR